MDDKEKFGVSMEEQLSEWKDKIDQGRKEAKKKGPDYFERYAGDLEKLSEKYDAARYKLTLFRKGGGEALGELKEGFERAFSELKSAVNKAWDKF